MGKDKIFSLENREFCADPLTDLLRDSAQRMLEQAILAERDEFLSRYEDQRSDEGLRAVVRSGYHPRREVQTGIGPVSVRMPKVRSNTAEAVTFRSQLVPPYLRRATRLDEFLPYLYLKGVSTGDMADALRVLVGEREVRNFSPGVVSRLKQVWAEEYRQWMQADLSQDQWVYLWADGIYCRLRGEDSKLCALVVIGVNEHGQKRILALEDGVRESTQSWRELLLGMKARGLRASKLAIGDGAMGFWSALAEIFPETRWQRCWVHKTANVLNALPKLSQPKAKQSLHQIWMAETREHAERAFDLFVRTYQDKYPKAVAILEKDRGHLLTFYDFPAAHWQSIRSTNPIESTFATIRHRTGRTRGCLNRNGMLCMLFKLGQSAEHRWRRLRGFRKLGQVIEGVKFKDGVEVTKLDNQVAA